jgi:hypothetical protein
MTVMIDGGLARALYDAGIRWQPANGDWFCLFDDTSEPWLIAPGAVELALIDGAPALLFHGASEWALDSVLAYEALWLPSETQVRELLMNTLGAQAVLQIEVWAQGMRCRAQVGDWRYEASSTQAVDAYALVLLAAMQNIRA